MAPMTDFEETTSFGAWRGGGRARERAVARLVLLRLRQKLVAALLAAAHSLQGDPDQSLPAACPAVYPAAR